jgi:hypothetical protein
MSKCIPSTTIIIIKKRNFLIDAIPFVDSWGLFQTFIALYKVSNCFPLVISEGFFSSAKQMLCCWATPLSFMSYIYVFDLFLIARVVNFSVLHEDVWLSQHHLLKRLFSPTCDFGAFVETQLVVWFQCIVNVPPKKLTCWGLGPWTVA